jgi:hypothetical protein
MAEHLKTMDIWELLARKAEVDAAIAEKRREMDKFLRQRRKSRRTKNRTFTRSQVRPSNAGRARAA